MRFSVKRLLFLFVLVAIGCNAQTTVTGTITDANGNAYANGTASAQIQTVSGQPTAPSVNTTTDSTGKFTMSLPAGSYVFTVCATPILLNIPTTNPTPKQVCFSNVTPIAISGPTQDVSGMLSASATTLGPKPSVGGVGFPTGTGIPQVSGGTSWGSTITVGGGVATALSQTVNTANGFCTGVGGACVAPAPITNAVQYVSATGNDANSGTAADDAHSKATIPSAWGALPASGGDVYVVGNVTSWAGGSVPANVHLHFAASSQTITMTGGITLGVNSQLLCSGQSTGLSGINNSGFPNGGTVLDWSGSSITSTTDLISAPGTSNADAVVIHGCYIRAGGKGRDGIHLGGINGSYVARNVIQDPGRDGIRLDNGAGAGLHSYDNLIVQNDVIHAAGIGYHLISDQVGNDIDRTTFLNDDYHPRDVGGATSTGTAQFQIEIPSGAGSAQGIGDTVFVDCLANGAAAASPGVNILVSQSGLSAPVKNVTWLNGEIEDVYQANSSPGLNITDTAPGDVQTVDFQVNPGSGYATITNMSTANATGFRYNGTGTTDSNSPNLHDFESFSNSSSSSPALANGGIRFITPNGHYILTPTSDGITRWFRTDGTPATQFTLWNPNWTTGGYLAFETNPSATLTAVNYFNINGLTAPRTTTVPDANTVLPQPLGAAQNTYVTGLSGTTGVLSTAVVGLTPVKKTATYTAVDTDRGSEFNFVITGAATFTTAAATNNWYVPAVINDPTSTATLTIAVPSGTLTNWGNCTVTTNQIALAAGFRVALATDNTNWYAICSPAGTSGSSWLLAHADATSQTANIATTTLYTPPASPAENGYTLQASVSCDSASASAAVTVTVKYTDASGTVITNNQAQATCTTLGSASNGQANLAVTVQGGTNVTYSTTITNTPTYSVHIGIMGPY